MNVCRNYKYISVSASRKVSETSYTYEATAKSDEGENRWHGGSGADIGVGRDRKNQR